MARFKRVACPSCGGHGLVWHGDVFDCRECDGVGGFFISEKDRLFEYPGGPAHGSWPGKFAKLEEQGVEDYEKVGRSIKECISFCRKHCTRQLGWNDEKRMNCMDNSACTQWERFVKREIDG
jgi:hypothetical protein